MKSKYLVLIAALGAISLLASGCSKAKPSSGSNTEAPAMHSDTMMDDKMMNSTSSKDDMMMDSKTGDGMMQDQNMDMGKMTASGTMDTQMMKK